MSTGIELSKRHRKTIFAPMNNNSNNLTTNDPLGTAAMDCLSGKRNLQIKVQSNIVEDDVIPVDYLFRHFAEMSPLEQKAILHSKGKVIDIGGGVGSHALELQGRGVDVTVLDSSAGCCQVAMQRGVKKVVNADFYTYQPQNKFDTVLLMMNGIGLAAAIEHLPIFFTKLKEYLNEGGQVILDSSDLRYLYIDEDSYCDLPDETYYGEVMYTMSYKQHKTSAFEWLFIDPALLAVKAKENGFLFEKIADGEHYDYLAKLTFVK